MIIRGYKYRIYPNNEQKALFEKHFGASRWIYNYGLERKIKEYQINKKTLSCFDLGKELPVLKTEKETSWLSEVNAQSLQVSLRSLDNAFKRFFREKKGFPSFKSKRSRKSFGIPQGNTVDFENNRASFIKIGTVKIKVSRTFTGRIIRATISKSSANKYFVSYLVETPEEPVKPKPVKEETTIGIDLGLKDFAVTSNGEKIPAPKFFRESEKRLAVLQRKLSKKRVGSTNRRKARLRVARLHEKINNQRLDFLHKLSYRLTHENQVQTIALETLNVEGMRKNHNLAKSISDASWSEFVNQIEYKSLWYGKNVLRIGRFEPSSKICSCGEINKDLKLSDREWTCKKCNTTHDRDILASNNIKKFALKNIQGR